MSPDSNSGVRNAAAGLRLVGKALLCCFFFAMIVLAMWFAGIVYEGDRIYSIHKAWFEMSRSEFDLIQYRGMMFFKLGAVLFFLLPSIGIWLAARSK